MSAFFRNRGKIAVFLLDTDSLTLIQQKHPKVIERAASFPAMAVFVSAISLQEQMKGWLGRLGRLSDRAKIASWYDSLVTRLFPVWQQFPLLSFSESAIARFEHLRSLKLNIGAMDLRIAAIALEYSYSVVTRNATDFGKVPGLAVVDWSS